MSDITSKLTTQGKRVPKLSEKAQARKDLLIAAISENPQLRLSLADRNLLRDDLVKTLVAVRAAKVAEAAKAAEAAEAAATTEPPAPTETTEPTEHTETTETTEPAASAGPVEAAKMVPANEAANTSKKRKATDPVDNDEAEDVVEAGPSKRRRGGSKLNTKVIETATKKAVNAKKATTAPSKKAVTIKKAVTSKKSVAAKKPEVKGKGKATKEADDTDDEDDTDGVDDNDEADEADEEEGDDNSKKDGKHGKKTAAPKSTTTKKTAAPKAATTSKTAAPKTAAVKKAVAPKAAPVKKTLASKPATAKKVAAPEATTARNATPPIGTAAMKLAEAARQKKAAARGPKKAATGAAKKAAPAKGKAKKADAGKPTTTALGKRKATEDDDKNESEDDEVEKDVPAAKKPKTRPVAAKRAKVVINTAPTDRLNVYVFGEGSTGELGLGRLGNITDVRRPRLNPKLPAAEVGVVQIAAGGMHSVALTHDSKIYTWGVNDQGALGRDTKSTAGMVIVEEEGDDREDLNDLNPLETNPRAAVMDNVPEGTVFVQVAAGDSITLALTDDGFVYGCGTFRSNEGILGFSGTVRVQNYLAIIPGLKKITKLVCGDNHCLALDKSGNVFAWGGGQQNQLGRKVVERTRMNGLIPREFGLPKNKIVNLGAGGYHSFAIDKAGNVWSWGLNSYGETGIRHSAGADEAIVFTATKVDALSGKGIISIDGGAHHSLAITDNGECLVWGRMDGSQTGLDVATIPEGDIIKDAKGNSRILMKPTAVPGLGHATMAAIGTDTSIVLNAAGQAYSWGFSANNQTGQGTEEDVAMATLIDNTAVRGKFLTCAGMGGQFGVLGGRAQE